MQRESGTANRDWRKKRARVGHPTERDEEVLVVVVVVVVGEVR
jgi:hypothetical protein